MHRAQAFLRECASSLPRHAAGVLLFLFSTGLLAAEPHVWKSYETDTQLPQANTWQLTLIWHRTAGKTELNFLVEGFADLAGDRGSEAVTRLITAPSLFFDLGKAAGQQPEKLWFGIEFSYWQNRLGDENVDDFLPQLKLKWAF